MAQKGFAHLMGIIIILIGIIIGVYLLGQKQIFTPKAASTTTAAVCKASDLSSLKNCFGKLTNNQTNKIEITNLITCSGSNACAFSLNNINRQVIVYGSTTGAGLFRTDTFTYPFLTINNSRGVLIKNLKFEENTNTTCRYPTDNCASTISIADSSNIFLDQLTINNSKAMGVAASNVHNFYVSNSTISNVAVFGIWMNNNSSFTSSDVHIVSNTFANNQSNAILFSANGGTTNSLNTITGNTFNHNHRNAVFSVCGASGKDPCSGGQLLIEQNTRNLQIANNTIQNGSNGSYSYLGTSGIEFANANISDVKIANNDIHDNTGFGIVANEGLSHVTNINISNNRLYSNNYGNIAFPTAQIANICTSADCSLSLITGKISASPNPCQVLLGSSQCTQTINWTSTNISNPQVKVGNFGGPFDGLFSINPSGGQMASWITDKGSQFNLYSGDTLIASTFVFGTQTYNTSLSPTPAAQKRGKSKKWNIF